MSNAVLVLEKEQQLGSLVKSMLAGRGVEVLTCASAHEGLDLLKPDPPQLIIVEEQLSDIDGLGFIGKLREANNKIAVAFVARQWRDEGFYRTLREDLKVSLVVHRPLRASVFSIQLLDLLGLNTSVPAPGTNNGSPPPLPLIETSSTNTPSGAEFDKLKRRFVSSIPERMGKLEQFMRGANNGSTAPAALEGAILVAHNLKGTSLSWGFEDFGKSSEHMETALKTWKGQSSELQAETLNGCTEIFNAMRQQAELITSQFESTITPEGSNNDSDERDSSAAKILVVSDDPPPTTQANSDLGIALDLIHVSKDEAIDKAGQILLDAALIEIGSHSAALGLARRLRDISGYEDLPLGFIAGPQASNARADATHAGSSVFLTKPLDAELVQKVIHQLISMREGGRFRVLVVDDDADLANLTSRCLGQFGMLTRTVNDPLLVNNALQEFNPDLILLDVNMPGMSGFEVCRQLRNSARWRDVPILFLTAQTDLNSRLTAYEAGADDYLPKPVINVELLTRVKVRLERARELKERSERDLLTGLLLRRAFSDQVDALIAECKRYNFHFSLCLLDVDHFKKVNDTYGHHAGDEVLSTFGKLLRKRFRVEDLRGRWGGEEFILAFKHENKEVMKWALDRIMDEFRQIDFKGENGEIFQVSFSAGIAAYPQEGQNLQELTKVADRRLYLAKERGRKQIILEDN